MTTPATELRTAAGRTTDTTLAALLTTLADAADSHDDAAVGVLATLVYPALAVARQILGTTTSAGPAAEETDEGREQREDREEAARLHAAGDHQYCDVTCEIAMPTEAMRNFVIAKGYPGTAGALDELLRRAAALPASVDRAAVLREAEAKAREIVAKLWDDGTTQAQLDRASGARAVEWEIGLMASGINQPAAPAAPEEPTWVGATELASDCEIAAVAATGVVGYQQDQGRLLHCLAHKPAPASRWADFHEVGADDLDDGGICVHHDCGRDLLAAWPAAPEEPTP